MRREAKKKEKARQRQNECGKEKNQREQGK